jgi:HlyD family secretion protein
MSKKSRFKLGFFLTVFFAVAGIGYLAVGNIFRSQAAIPDDRLATIERGDLSLAVVATGSVVPEATVEVKSKASGLIKSILVDEGDLVREGEILAELDKEILQAQLREAEASRLAVAARVEEGRSERVSASSMKRKMEMDLENLEDSVAFHEKQVQRFETLFREKLIPLADLDERERQVQQARFEREALRSELLMQDARILAAEKAVVRAQAELAQAAAVLDRARENLRYATIRSPLTATVLRRHLEVGDAVSSILQLGSQATLILTLGDMKQVFFEGRVDETDIGKVFVGQEARVRVDAFRDRPFPGKVLRIAPLGQEKDNVIGFEVRVAINDAEGILRARMSANAEIIVEERKDILLIPESAVIYDRDRNRFAEIYEPSAEGLRVRVPIEIGISDGTTTELIAGVEEGRRVIRVSTGGII